MSQQLINRSPDLKRLQDEGYDVEIVAGYLLIKHVPYVNVERQVAFGVLVSTLSLSGDVTTRPDDHVVRFAGSTPCDADGRPLNKILNSSSDQNLTQDLVINHTFSSKPAEGYKDYYDKMTTYVHILETQAARIDESASARPHHVIQGDQDESVFAYIDNASSRAQIAPITEKLSMRRVAIVGLGGTGSYILDLVSKTPTREIHLFDGDVFLQHNAFRSPGAATVKELREAPHKVDYFRSKYTHMHLGIIAHAYNIGEHNVHELGEMDFVFLAMEGPDRGPIVQYLERSGIPFVDVGMGIYEVEGSLAGLLRVTASTPNSRRPVNEKGRIPLSAEPRRDDYSRNIQIADLNALNATLAVIKWKKICGFYLDIEREYFSVYAVDGNHIVNDDQECHD